MEVIFELVSGSARSLQRCSSASGEIKIGRAFDSDFILDDETVSPRHAVVSLNDSGGLRITDCSSLNGITVNRGQRVGDSIDINSGDECTFGRTRVRVFLPSHAVADAVPVSRFHWLTDEFGRARYLGAMLLLVGSLAVLGQWLNTFTEAGFQEHTIGLVGVMLASFTIALFWAIVGRIIKHEARFRTQLGLVFTYLVGQTLIVLCYEVILFNTLSEVVAAVFGLIASFLLLVAAFAIALNVSTNQTNRQRLRYGSALAAILIGLSVYPQLLELSEFSETPRYVKEVKAPAFRFRDGGSVAAFVDRSETVFDATESEERRD